MPIIDQYTVPYSLAYDPSVCTISILCCNGMCQFTIYSCGHKKANKLACKEKLVILKVNGDHGYKMYNILWILHFYVSNYHETQVCVSLQMGCVIPIMALHIIMEYKLNYAAGNDCLP